MKITTLYSTYLKSRINSSSFSYNIYSFIYGLIGFLSFFSVIILGKLYRYTFNYTDFISIEDLDLILSAIGFVMVFLYKRFEHK
ncbi:MAG: hypothetical protein EHM47_02875 [Ignavibacteriales bacterium]|nr:MAG: hypothetical protein EHM47_02875 [Ignavibacteriales bacterium]